ncbi:hypothetical protein FHG87_013522 [Trinorchestia longiramus]|nr:hypothetical protein FHG87_013522 [Trinorchestia longiramus]
MTDITTSKLWHVFNVILYVVGIAGGISGGATFHFHFNNNAASLWAAVSVLVIFICLVQELLKHNDRLHVCHTHHSLIICQVLASLMALVLVVLSVMHFVVAYVGEEVQEFHGKPMLIQAKKQRQQLQQLPMTIFITRTKIFVKPTPLAEVPVPDESYFVPYRRQVLRHLMKRC